MGSSHPHPSNEEAVKLLVSVGRDGKGVFTPEALEAIFKIYAKTDGAKELVAEDCMTMQFDLFLAQLRLIEAVENRCDDVGKIAIVRDTKESVVHTMDSYTADNAMHFFKSLQLDDSVAKKTAAVGGTEADAGTSPKEQFMKNYKADVESSLKRASGDVSWATHPLEGGAHTVASRDVKSKYRSNCCGF